MEKKVKKHYHWYEDFAYPIKWNIAKTNPKMEWFVDEVTCNNCGFYFSSITRIDVNHPVKYCPGCGGFIEGVENPIPPKK